MNFINLFIYNLFIRLFIYLFIYLFNDLFIYLFKKHYFTSFLEFRFFSHVWNKFTCDTLRYLVTFAQFKKTQKSTHRGMLLLVKLLQNSKNELKSKKNGIVVIFAVFW